LQDHATPSEPLKPPDPEHTPHSDEPGNEELLGLCLQSGAAGLLAPGAGNGRPCKL